jgi:hypothetical protein
MAMQALTENERIETLDRAILFAWSTLEQIRRVHDSEAELAVIVEHRPTRIDHAYRIPFLRSRADRHYMVVAARNLMRALDLLDPPAHVTAPTSPGDLDDHVRILRDCGEHWDERNAAGTGNAGRAFRDHAAKWPDAPDAYQFGGRGSRFGGLELDELQRHVEAVLAFLLETESGHYVWRGWPPAP